MKKYIILFTAFLAAGLASCKKNYLDEEVNPNQPSVTTPNLTLTGALNASAAIIVNDYSQYGVWTGYWTTSGNYVPSQTINQYQFTNSNFNGDWNDWYSNLTNYNNLYNLSTAPVNANFAAIALIMKAYGFQHLVDNYNDVPYSQAFQPSTILFPAYDQGINIYHDLGKQLDAAIALIQKNPTATNPGTSDIVFGGNMTGWIKFANSLKLRLAVRISSKYPTDQLVTDLASTASLGYLDGTTQALCNPGYSDLAGKQNPFYGTFGFDANNNPTGNNLYFRANAFSVNTLESYGDPRVTYFYALTQPPGSPSSAPASIVRGNTFGDPKALANSNTSAIGPGLLQSPSQSEPLFSGAESLFLQAEAVQDGFITSSLTAQQLYQNGITASFEALGLTDAQAAAYYSQPIANVGWTSSVPEQAIITQKWISLNGLFNFEGWNEYRRTGIPNLPSSIDPAAISSTLPTRIFYPLSETQTNAANLDKEPVVNPFTSKIFWAK
jgi:hypothetical protein